MPDHDLNTLLKTLDYPVSSPPPFGEIRARRSVRTRRLLTRASVSVIVLLMAGLAVMAGTGRNAHRHPPIAPSPTGTGLRTTGGNPPGRVLRDTLAYTTDGWAYFLSDACVRGCESSNFNSAVFADVLYRSVDRGRHWQVVHGPDDSEQFNRFDGDEQLLVGSRQNLWIQDGARLLTSTDGGSTWFTTELPVSGAYTDLGFDHPLGMVGQAAWFLLDGTVWTVAAPNGPPIPLAHAPSAQQVSAFAAVSATRALLVSRGNLGAMTWYATDDRGLHWHLTADPCTAVGEQFVDISPTPDGTVWAECQAGRPGYSDMLFRSADGGRTWQPARPAPGSFTDAHPVSSTVLWYGVDEPLPGVFRSTDGAATWSPAGHGLPMIDGPSIFAAYDADVAVDAWEGDRYVAMYVTTDGGATWTPTPLP